MERLLRLMASLDGVGLVAGHDLGPVSGGKELLARQGDALLGFAGDDLPIIGIVALNQLGNDLCRKAFAIAHGESSLVFRKSDLNVSLFTQQPG